MIDIAFRRERIVSALRNRDRLALQIGEHLIAVEDRFDKITENEKAARDAYAKFLSEIDLTAEDAERFIDLRQER